MTPFEVYRDYIALRNHFNSKSYDYFKYGGKSSGNVDSFNKRKDKFFFEKLAKHRDPHHLMLANFAVNPKSWIKEMAYSENAEAVYMDWLKRSQSLTHNVRTDLGKMDPEFNNNIICSNGSHPLLLRLFLGKQITLETVCILADMTKCHSYWGKQLGSDPVWEELGTTIKKYQPFIKYDKPKVTKVVVDYFNDQQETK